MKKAVSILFVAIFLLSGCAPPDYKVEVDLTPEKIVELQTQIKESQEAIQNFKGEAGSIANLDIIDLANAYKDLGELGKAIEVYEKVLEQGDKTKAILHNLGRLYERVGEYNKAAKAYQRIADEYLDYDYLLDISWLYVNAKDFEEAKKYYQLWQAAFNSSDATIEAALDELKKSE